MLDHNKMRVGCQFNNTRRQLSNISTSLNDVSLKAANDSFFILSSTWRTNEYDEKEVVKLLGLDSVKELNQWGKKLVLKTAKFGKWKQGVSSQKPVFIFNATAIKRLKQYQRFKI